LHIYDINSFLISYSLKVPETGEPHKQQTIAKFTRILFFNYLSILCYHECKWWDSKTYPVLYCFDKIFYLYSFL